MTCRELIAQVQVLLGDPHGDYHTQAGLLIQVNQALRDISSRSRSVQVKQFHRAIAGQYEYGLPSGFLEMHIAAFYHVDWYQLTPATIASIESISSWVSSNIPWNYDVWGNAAREKVVANVASNTDNELTIDAAHPSVLAGDRIINLSDAQSEGIVQSVSYSTEDGETTITYSSLRGGTRTTFEALMMMCVYFRLKMHRKRLSSPRHRILPMLQVQNLSGYTYPACIGSSNR